MEGEKCNTLFGNN